MDRRGFLGLIGCGAGAVALGPLLPASEPVGFLGMTEGSSFVGIPPGTKDWAVMGRAYETLPLEYTGDAMRRMQRYYNAAWNEILDRA